MYISADRDDETRRAYMNANAYQPYVYRSQSTVVREWKSLEVRQSVVPHHGAL